MTQHIEEFLDIVNVDKDSAVGKHIYSKYIFNNVILGLGYYSEQSFESMHHDIKVYV